MYDISFAQAATEKEMFIGIATGLENEVHETKKAMEQVFEEYPHLKGVVNQAGYLVPSESSKGVGNQASYLLDLDDASSTNGICFESCSSTLLCSAKPSSAKLV